MANVEEVPWVLEVLHQALLQELVSIIDQWVDQASRDHVQVPHLGLRDLLETTLVNLVKIGLTDVHNKQNHVEKMRKESRLVDGFSKRAPFVIDDIPDHIRFENSKLVTVG